MKYVVRDFLTKWVGRAVAPVMLWLLRDRHGETLWDDCERHGITPQLFD